MDGGNGWRNDEICFMRNGAGFQTKLRFSFSKAAPGVHRIMRTLSFGRPHLILPEFGASIPCQPINP